MLEQIQETIRFLNAEGVTNPDLGIILGTGLGSQFVREIKNRLVVDYSAIPHFPMATVEHHQGKLIFGDLAGKKVLAMQGRFHHYEGYTMQQITFPVRVMKLMGIRHLLISNAAGNLNLAWRKGDMMLVNDHINLQGENPLRGGNLDTLGPRFPDMSQPYDPRLNEMLLRIATGQEIDLRRGVYVAVTGPNLETRAEYRYLRNIGADAVGMSTVPEVIVANHMGLPCCAVSVLTDDCDPDNLKAVSLDEIISVAGRTEPKLTNLFIELIRQL
jgi:purine-nucleoside phosphorylase